MNGPDYTELFTGRPNPEHGGSLHYSPALVLLLTVTHNQTSRKSSTIETIVAPEHVLSSVDRLTEDFPVEGVHRAIFILGPYQPAASFELDEDFPRSEQDLKEIIGEPRVPFSRQVFASLMELLSLPKATPWALATGSAHFKEYGHYDTASSASGTKPEAFTSQATPCAYPHGGVIPMNIGLSISHSSTTRTTRTLLVGASAAQSRYIAQQLGRLANIAHHPLLLPALLCGHFEFLLRVEIARLWNELVAVETASGRGDVVSPVLLSQRKAETDEAAHADLTRAALGVAQLSSSWQSGVQNLMAKVPLLKESIAELKVVGGPAGSMKEASALLEEALNLTSQKASMTLGDLQMIEKRVSAQMNAIYNYTAQRIATAAMRDSSAMKAIAVLTMFFLPATFMASLFAMPLLDFSAGPGAPVVQPRFWIYWVCTIPITLAVGVIYFGYLWWQDRAKQGRSDAKDPLTLQVRPHKSYLATTTRSEASSVATVATTRPPWLTGQVSRRGRSATLELPVVNTATGNRPVESLFRAPTARAADFNFPTSPLRFVTSEELMSRPPDNWERRVSHTTKSHRSPSRRRHMAVTHLLDTAIQDDNSELSYRDQGSDGYFVTARRRDPSRTHIPRWLKTPDFATPRGREAVPRIQVTEPDFPCESRGRDPALQTETTEREESPEAALRVEQESSAQWGRNNDPWYEHTEREESPDAAQPPEESLSAQQRQRRFSAP